MATTLMLIPFAAFSTFFLAASLLAFLFFLIFCCWFMFAALWLPCVFSFGLTFATVQFLLSLRKGLRSSSSGS